MRLTRHVARIEEMRMQTQFCRNLKRRNQLEDLCIDGRIILEWILEQHGGKLCTGFFCLRIETSGGLLWTR